MSSGKVDEDEVSLNMMLPPGFRFKPTAEELLMDYLKPKVMNQSLPPNMINSVDLYKYNPITLTERFKKRKDDDEWYFFTTATRTSKTTGRTRRTTPDGFWIASQGDQKIHSTGAESSNSRKRKTREDDIIGYRKMLVYYFNKENNKPDKKSSSQKDAGIKTNWIMYEYVLLSEEEEVGADKKRHELVLCQIHQNNNGKTPAAAASIQTIPMISSISAPPPEDEYLQEVEPAPVHHQQDQYLQEVEQYLLEEDSVENILNMDMINQFNDQEWSFSVDDLVGKTPAASVPMISTTSAPPPQLSSPMTPEPEVEPAPVHHQQDQYQEDFIPENIPKNNMDLINQFNDQEWSFSVDDFSVDNMLF